MKKISLIVVGIFILALVTYDAVALIIGGDAATISAVAYNFAKQFPIFPFALGIVFGHLFWGQTPETRGEK
jgi:hypothetical protein